MASQQVPSFRRQGAVGPISACPAGSVSAPLTTGRSLKRYDSSGQSGRQMTGASRSLFRRTFRVLQPMTRPISRRFSIFISGLSNGWVITDPAKKGDLPVVRRKTLQLNFRRIGDRFLMDSRDISFIPPAEWMYRASTLKIPEAPKPDR